MIKKLIVGILLLIFIFTGSVIAETNFREADVVDLFGTVNVKKSGGEKTFQAFKGMSLNTGDRIMTSDNSWILLNFDSDKEVKIDQNTDIVISEISFNENSGEQKTGISLWAGRIWASIKRGLGIRESFEVKTPTTVMGVKGTMFYVDRRDENTVVAVLDGRVYTVVTTGSYDDSGNYIKEELELMLEKNSKLTVDDIKNTAEDLIVKEVAIEELDLFILEELVKNLKEKQLNDPDTSEDVLIKLLDQMIDNKKSEVQSDIPKVVKYIMKKSPVFEEKTEEIIEEYIPQSFPVPQYSQDLLLQIGLNTNFGPVDIQPGKYDYQLMVSSDAESIKITPAVLEPFTDGTIEIKVGTENFGNVNNKEESGEIFLNSDNTTITIIIKEPSKYSKIYRLYVVKDKYVFTDDFDTSYLNEKWTILYPDYEYLALSADPGYLTITQDQGDLFLYPDKTTKNIFTMEPGFDDFTITSKMLFAPIEPNGQAGIMIYSDEYNFFAITRQYDRASDRSAIYVMSRYNGYSGLEKYEDRSTGMNMFSEGSANDIYFKIIKKGNYCTAYYSYDSNNWFKAFLETPNLEFADPKAAFYACANDNFYNQTAVFDSFTLSNAANIPQNFSEGVLLNDTTAPFTKYPEYAYAIYSNESIQIRFNEAITSESKAEVEEKILASLFGEDRSESEYLTFTWDEFENDRIYYMLTIKNTNEETFYFFNTDVSVDIEDMAGNTSKIIIISPQAY